MPTLTIDDQEIQVEPGTTVIQAAERLGVYIPRYCYHPGLSIAGSCRMCLVEVEKIPTLQISCNTVVRDGMVVRTNTERVKIARKQMLEFLLTNHPLDCPVCDQSGECDLQNFYMEYGRYQSRFYEDKIKKKKAYGIGPHVLLDQERCILCSRCVRFTEEVSGTHELGIFNRGNRSVIDLYPDRVLDNPYSGNVIDICPVGALTEIEFRFKCRVWYLSSEESICTGCARGCNISIHYNGSLREYKAGGSRVQRLKPRYNPKVNHWWMCDEGRFGFEYVDRNRIHAPQLRRDGKLVPASWESAIGEAAKALHTALENYGPESIGVIVSPHQSNEELFLVREIFREELQSPNLAAFPPLSRPETEDEFLIRADKSPNSKGVELLELNGDASQLLDKAAAGEIKVLVVFGPGVSSTTDLENLAQAQFLIYVGTNWNGHCDLSHVVLASSTHAEKEGTFTNFEGLVQRFRQALLPLEESRDDLEILRELAEAIGHPVRYQDSGEVFQAWQNKAFDEIEEHGEQAGELAGASAES